MPQFPYVKVPKSLLANNPQLLAQMSASGQQQQVANQGYNIYSQLSDARQQSLLMP